jgi:hypothetical protein
MYHTSFRNSSHFSGLFEAGFSDTLEHIPQVVKLFPERPTDNDNLIQLHQAGF